MDVIIDYGLELVGIRRQAEAELGAALRTRLGPDPSAHRRHELPAHEEADAGSRGAAGLLRGPEVEVEQLVGVFLVRNADIMANRRNPRITTALQVVDRSGES